MDRQKLSITEPRAEWRDETVEKLTAVVRAWAPMLARPDDAARAILVNLGSEAVPRAEHEELREASEAIAAADARKIAVLREAESQLATYRTALEELLDALGPYVGYAVALRGERDGFNAAEAKVAKAAQNARAALGGPDDAPKEPE